MIKNNQSTNEIVIRSAKRGRNERTGVHSWHPYYAGYSENFVFDTLRFFGANHSSIVLDPWIGSGTTAVACQKMGVKCIGIDINPVLIFFTKAKCARLLDFDLNKFANEILSRVNSTNGCDHTKSGLSGYLSLQSYDVLKSIQLASEEFIAALTVDVELKEHLLSFFYSAIFRCIRKVGFFRTGSNPTWLHSTTPSESKHNILTLFKDFVGSMREELHYTFANVGNLAPLPCIYIANSKSIPLGSDSVDYIITSPPYLTRIDYAMSTKPELLFLGYEPGNGFDLIRRSTMGAPVIRDKNIFSTDKWGIICESFLSKVTNHSSKAACSYYLPIFLQYFKDAQDSLVEIQRVLHNQGKACLVVQTSYFKEIEIQLDKIYVEMGAQLGMNSYIKQREQVRQHIAHLNTGSTSYSGTKVYYEAYVIFEKVSP